jgi:hypothetical protein
MLGRCAKAEIGGESTQLRWTFVGGLFRLTFIFPARPCVHQPPQLSKNHALTNP